MTSTDAVVVIGLGRFGGSVAETLTRLDHDVLAIDSDPDVVQRWSDRLTHVVEADGADAEALAALGVADCRRAVVGIGANIEASVLTVLALDEAGVRHILAKAITPDHEKILLRVGADDVVAPESAMGARVGHLVAGNMKDFFEFDGAFAIAKLAAPSRFAGRRVADCGLRERYGVTVIGIERGGQTVDEIDADTGIEAGDLLIVSGATRRVEAFAQRR